MLQQCPPQVFGENNMNFACMGKAQNSAPRAFQAFVRLIGKDLIRPAPPGYFNLALKSTVESEH
jgi:hypothetical protein